MDDSSVTVRVNICGTEYPIQAAEEAEYIQRIAAYVDERMRQVPVSVTMQSLTSVAVLTAVRIADELHKERENKKSLAESELMQDERLTTLMQRVDDVLKNLVSEDQEEERLVNDEQEKWSKQGKSAHGS